MKKDIAVQQLAPQSGEVVLYNPDDTIRLEVRMNEETVWLSQSQMAELFRTDRTSIVRHIKNIYAVDELSESATCAKIAQVRLGRANNTSQDLEKNNCWFSYFLKKVSVRFFER